MNLLPWKKQTIKTNADLVKLLLKRKLISEVVANAMLEVDRKNFVKEKPYSDVTQGINGQVLLSPVIQAQIVEELKDHLLNGSRMLNIGMGIGYLTVLFAVILGPEGIVVLLNKEMAMLENATKNIHNEHHDFLSSGRVRLNLGDVRKGYPEFAPYDAIFMESSFPTIPNTLLDQLKHGGRMIACIKTSTTERSIETFNKLEDGTIDRHPLQLRTLSNTNLNLPLSTTQ